MATLGILRLRFLGLLVLLAMALVFLAAPRARADAVVAWGQNEVGELGNGTTNINPNPTPGAVTGMSIGVTAITAGGGHGLALQNGGLYAWGDNSYGQLGNGTTINSSTPVALTGVLSSGVTAIAAGGGDSFALQNGGLYAWGSNGVGELGNGTTTDSHSPVALTGVLSSGVTAIAAGGAHSLAVQNAGLYAWGYNSNGQLGNGTTTSSTTPVALTGVLSSGVTSIAAGTRYSLAVQNGGLYAWGNNRAGQLGNGTTTDSNTPVALTGVLSSGVTAIAAGGDDRINTHTPDTYYSLAVQNGNVYAWGDNVSGQLGDGTTTNRLTPEEIDPTDLYNIVSVAAGHDSSYALCSDGSLWVWGDNGWGQLGLGTSTTDYLTPQQLLPPSGYVYTSISANFGGYFALATLEAVREPTSLSLLALGLLPLLARPRRSRSRNVRAA